MDKPKKIAIDGPVGVGKSTVARIVAGKLGFAYIDTGAMYRAAAYFLINRNIDIEEQATVCESLRDLLVKFDETQRIFVGSQDVTPYIRTQEISGAASVVAAYPCVREKLVKLQQLMAAKTNVVMDGRDIASHVLPDADLKIYLDAELDIRAQRRLDDLLAKGQKADYDEVRKETAIRDERDMNRTESPLVKTPDAVVIDTGGIKLEEVVERVLSEYKKIGVC